MHYASVHYGAKTTNTRREHGLEVWISDHTCQRTTIDEIDIESQLSLANPGV